MNSWIYFIDEIIKEKRKLKKKALKQKTQQTQKKGVKQQQGRKQGNKGAAVKQNQRRRIAGKNAGQSAQLRQGIQGRKRTSAGKQSGQFVQQGRGGGNQNYRKNQAQGNKGRTRGGRVAANRLKNKQTSVQKVSCLCCLWQSCLLCACHIGRRPSLRTALFPMKSSLMFLTATWL